MRKLLLFVAVVALSREASPQTGTRPEILVLGSYHMANPGRDVHYMSADDVLAPKRQGELAELIEVLKRFRPTKIAIEAAVGSKRVAQEYADYVAGTYPLSRNENDQIGYRLAKELGHRTVYLNADSAVARDLAEYFAFVPFADRFEYAGPDLLAMWYQRNIRIYHHIIALVESPHERILVLYGAGHLGWLRQNVANDATVRLRKLAALTGER